MGEHVELLSTDGQVNADAASELHRSGHSKRVQHEKHGNVHAKRIHDACATNTGRVRDACRTARPRGGHHGAARATAHATRIQCAVRGTTGTACIQGPHAALGSAIENRGCTAAHACSTSGPSASRRRFAHDASVPCIAHTRSTTADAVARA